MGEDEKAASINVSDASKTESPQTSDAKENYLVSANEVTAQTPRYDPSKEKLLTRLGLNIESFKRAPGSTWEHPEIMEFEQDSERYAQNIGKNPMLQQTMKNRHMQMIAVGGSIGTGLFVGSGKALANGGPAGVLIAWIIIAAMILNTMQNIGEMAIIYPVTGGFYTLTNRFLDPAWGFAMGWNYAMQWAGALPLELTAAEITIRFWTNALPAPFWVTMFFLLIIAIALFGTLGYAEEEFWTSCLKLLVVVMFLVLGLVLIGGGGPADGAYSTAIGGKFWKDPGPFANGFKGVCAVFVTAAFSFAGTELVGLAATETKNPEKSLPRAIKMTFWRVALIYISTLTIIGLLVPFNDADLLKPNTDGKTSPFVIVLVRAKISGLDSLINATICVSVLSIGCSCVYGASRTILALAEGGFAPKFLAYVDKAGRPSLAILLVLLFGFIGYLNEDSKVVLDWLLALSALSTLFTWLSINLAHIRFRQAWAYHGKSLDELPYRAAFGVWGSAISAVVIGLVLIAQLYVAVSPIDGAATAEQFFLAMLALPVVLVLYIVGLIWKGIPDSAWREWTWRRPFAVFKHFSFQRVGPRSLANIDLITGRRCWKTAEELNAVRAHLAQRPLWKRIYYWFF